MNILIFQCYNCDKKHEVRNRNIAWDDRFRQVELNDVEVLRCHKCQRTAFRLIEVKHI